MEPQTDTECLAELAQIWRKLARSHAADPDGPWGALLVARGQRGLDAGQAAGDQAGAGAG